MWLHEQMLPGSRAYNFTAVLNLRGELNEPALRSALQAIVDHHPGLRLELVEREGELPAQRIREAAEAELRDSDLSASDDVEADFRRLLVAEAEEPLDTARAPMLRWHLVRTGEREHRLIHVEHHLVHDGMSFGILLRDLFNTYLAHVRGEHAELSDAPSYEEHARAVAIEAAEGRDKSLTYLCQEFEDAPREVLLPGLSSPGAVRSRRGGQIRQSIEAGVAERLRAVSKENGHTPFSTLLTLFGEMLRRHSGHEEMVVGSAVGNRPAGFEDTLGMFVNTVPLKLRLRGSAQSLEVVDDVTDSLLRALLHQHIPVQTLTRELGLHTEGVDNPLFNVMFSAHDAPVPEIDVPGLDIGLYEAFNTGTTRFDLDLVLFPDDRRSVGVREGASGMTLIWDYDRDVFTEDVVGLLTQRMLELVRAYLDDPRKPLNTLAPATAETAERPSGENGAPDFALLSPTTRHDPARPAVSAGAQQLTYGELDRRVSALAERLASAGVTAGRPVAALLPRGVDNVVALLACLRLGAVYAPLSTDDPAGRLALLVDGLRPALVLATRESALALPAGTVAPALLDGAAFPQADPDAPVLDDAAYIIHTSGSTGVPKPVLVGRAALADYIGKITGRFGLTAEDRVLLFARPSFDVALEEVLPALAAGSCLVLPQREVPTGAELTAVLAARRVTVVNLPTSYFLSVSAELREALGDGRWAPRLIVLGGERLPADALRGLLSATTATVLNAYGVTEAVVTSTVHEVTAADLERGGEIPLGRELPGVRVHVLDEGGQPLPAGCVGELAVSGTLAEGYAGREEATAERFVTLGSLGSLGGERVYLTGDRGHRDLEGRLCFLGRRDNQVKLRGHRIELEEIESAASAALGGRSCAVVLDRDGEGGPRLVGFVAGPEPVDQAELHAELAARLPGALTPAVWTGLEAMPTLPGGKPDRAALARLAGGVSSPAGTREDRDAVFGDPELALVAEGWQEVLGHDRFGADSHFFQVGGHSLLAAQLAAWLEPRLGRRPALRTLFKNPVLADQADVLMRGDQ